MYFCYGHVCCYDGAKWGIASSVRTDGDDMVVASPYYAIW